MKRFTEAEINEANSINLIAYAEQIGLNLKKVGNSYKVKDYGGLYIDAIGAKWNWFSKDAGGGPIQFVMEMEGKNWVDAVYTLLGTEKAILHQDLNRLMMQKDHLYCRIKMIPINMSLPISYSQEVLIRKLSMILSAKISYMKTLIEAVSL